MPAERYYHPTSFAVGEEVTLEAMEGRHLMTVMRGNSGDHIELFDGKGHLAQATVVSVDKKRGVAVSVDSVTFEEAQQRTVTLFQAVPRWNRLDTILEKTTELGVTDIVLFPAERSEQGDLSISQQQRVQKVLVAAAKQCGRLWLPRVTTAGPISAWEPPVGDCFFGDISPDAPLLRTTALDRARAIAIVVGPESGLTDGEENALRTLGAIGVSLNGNVLRTDTAAIVGIAFLV